MPSHKHTGKTDRKTNKHRLVDKLYHSHFSYPIAASCPANQCLRNLKIIYIHAHPGFAFVETIDKIGNFSDAIIRE